MKLYCITQSSSRRTTIDLLRASASERSVGLIEIQSDNFNFSAIPDLTGSDILYRIAIDRHSTELLKLMLNDKVVTFFRNNATGICQYDNVIEAPIVHKNHGLPIIKTIFDLNYDRKMLEKYAEYLGGFPLVIKASGGSHGIGVIKIDSFSSLLSIVDMLKSTHRSYIMRQFIDYIVHARLIVLGNKVVSSIEYKKIAGDFRSNSSENLTIINRKFDIRVEETAVKAVNVLGYEFGGVDILIDKKDRHFIAEVNFPCYFPRAQLATGVDISGMMLDYLLKKAGKTT